MRNKLILLLMLPLLLLTPGCWDLHDVNSTAFVLGIGIDSPTNSDPAKYAVTFQFAKPVAIHGNPTTEIIEISTNADSILQAIQRTQASVGRVISLSHLRVVVIGEDIARGENFQDLTNYILREPDLALQLRLAFVQDARAQDFYRSNARFGQRPTGELVSMGKFSSQIAVVRTRDFLDFVSDLKNTNGTAFGSRITIKNAENTIVQDGAAVYKDWKLVSWLNAEEVQAANWLVEKKTQPVVVAEAGDNTYTYEVRSKDTKFKSIFDEGKPFLEVHVKTEGMVMEEYGQDLDLSQAENLREMESLFAEAIREQVTSAIQKSQKEIKADYLGLGKAFRNKEPGAFKLLDWSEVYPTMSIDVQVDCKVKAYGLHK